VRRLLLVEDDPSQARALSKILVQHEFWADIATTGRQAIELAREFRYSLVLLDWRLPDVDGLEVLRHIRSANSDSAILMVSGRSSPADVVTALGAGADDYVVKPYDSRLLVARIQALLRRTGSDRTQLNVGRIAINLRTNEVTVDSAQVALTHLELRLLLVLADHFESTVKRSEILAAIWGNCYEGASNALDVHVCHLREKLRSSGTVIETVRGVGYRLRGVPGCACC